MSSPTPPVINIRINNCNSQTNNVSTCCGRCIPSETGIRRRSPTNQAHSNAPDFIPQFSTAIERRIEAQSQICQALEEVSTQHQATSLPIGTVALFATQILSAIKVFEPIFRNHYRLR